MRRDSVSGRGGGIAGRAGCAAPRLALAGVLAALCAAAALPPAATAAVKPTGAKNLILRPAAGKKLPARPTAIAVRAGRRAKVGMKLNGKPIASWLSRPSRRGLRSLRASPSHGLRHGRNVLWVRVLGRGAERPRVRRIRFRIRRNRPLAAAGLGRRVALHSGFGLSGHKSRAHPAGRGTPLRFRWRLLSAPRGSILGVAQRRRARSSAARSTRVRNLGPAPRFDRRGRIRPRLRFDHPGAYRFRLTAIGPDRRRGSDQVTVIADPDPAVSIDTMAQQGGSPGVRVGKQFYADPGKGKQWLQLVVLDAKTLEEVANRSFDCPAATNVNPATASPAVSEQVLTCVRELSQYARGLPKQFAARKHGFLGIVVSQPTPGAEGDKYRFTQVPFRWWDALRVLGAAESERSEYRGTANMVRGSLSWVGLLGPPDGIGQAVVHDVAFDLSQPAESGITGMLLRDNNRRYTSFASPDRVSFDTQAEGSSATQSVIRVGPTNFTEAITEGGGFHVVVLSKETLTPGPGYHAESHWFPTHGTNPNKVKLALEGMTAVLEAARQDDHRSFSRLVLIATRGDPRIVARDQTGAQRISSRAQHLVALLVGRYGATNTRAFQALDPLLAQNPALRLPQPAGSYTLVAEAETMNAEGLERSGAVGEGGLNTVPVSGVIARAASGASYDYGFEPGGAEPGQRGGGGQALRDVAFSQVGEWPERAKSKGYKEAIDYVGRKAFGTQWWDRQRSVYWTQIYDEGYWLNRKEDVASTAYPGTKAVKFGKAEFLWAKEELKNEIVWLEETHGFAVKLANPYRGSEGTVSAYVESVADDVNKAVKPLPSSTATMDLARVVVETVLEAGGAFPPPAGEIADGLSAVWVFATGVAKINGQHENESTSAPFSASVGKLADEAGTRLETAAKVLENQLVDVVAADYRKLRTVGLCAAGKGDCPGGGTWKFTQDEEKTMEELVKQGLQVSLFGSLFPQKWSAWAIFQGADLGARSTKWPSGTEHLTPAYEHALAITERYYCPLITLAPTAQFWFPEVRALHSVAEPAENSRSVVIAFANKDKNESDFDMPDPTTTNRLFGTGDGQLGVDPETFWRRYYLAAHEPLHDFKLERGSWHQARWIKVPSAGQLTSSCRR